MSSTPRRSAEQHRLRLLPPVERVRSHRLTENAPVGPSGDGRLRTRLRGVPLWEKSGDGAAFALGFSPVGGRVVGALRIVR